MTSSPSEDAETRRATKLALVAVAIFGGLLSLGALLFSGFRMAFSVGVGAGLAAVNLYILSKIVRGLTRPAGGGLYGIFAVAKVLGLLLGVWALLKLSVVDPLGLVVGLAALPLGIAVSSLATRTPS